MIVFMFKDLFTNTASPYYAQFASSSLTGADMFPLLWKVIERLTRTGCYILGVTCDGRLFQLHQLLENPKEKNINKALNPFTNQVEEILFLWTLLICLKQFEIVFRTQLEICG